MNKSVKTIELGANAIGNEGAVALADTLKVDSSLVNIYLGGN
jgi:hypothetical protein